MLIFIVDRITGLNCNIWERKATILPRITLQLMGFPDSVFSSSQHLKSENVQYWLRSDNTVSRLRLARYGSGTRRGDEQGKLTREG